MTGPPAAIAPRGSRSVAARARAAARRASTVRFMTVSSSSSRDPKFHHRRLAPVERRGARARGLRRRAVSERRSFRLHRGLQIHEPPSAESAVVISRLEFYSIRPGPDGLSRITRRAEGLRRDSRGGSFAPHAGPRRAAQNQRAPTPARHRDRRRLGRHPSPARRVLSYTSPVKGSMNEVYLDDLRDKTHRGPARSPSPAVTSPGGKPSATAPRGPARSAPPSRSFAAVHALRSIPPKAAIVRRIFRGLRRMDSLRAIASPLNNAGVPFPAKGTRRERVPATAGRFVTVRWILRNERYVGR